MALITGFHMTDAEFCDHAERLLWRIRFESDLREANRLRFEAFERNDAELHRMASARVFLLTREARR